MYFCKVLTLCFLIALAANAQTVNVRGKVVNKAGTPVSKAIVTLLRQDLKDTTGADGAFSITKNVVAVVQPIVPHTETMSFNKGVLELSLASPAPVNVEIFDVKGQLLKKEFDQNASAGVYRLDIAANPIASNVLVIHASIGSREMTFRYLPLQGGNHSVNATVKTALQQNTMLSKVAADIDSLKVTADGYKSSVVKIPSYDTNVDITLDSANGALCEGCGKTNYPKSGKATIDVGGTSREYTLLLPENLIRISSIC